MFQIWRRIKWRLLVAMSSAAKFSAAKADPVLITMLAIASAAAAPSAVLDNYALVLWLLTGSACGMCFVLFGDDKVQFSWRLTRIKLFQCFIPGVCFTGAAIVGFGATPSAELVLGLSLVLSVAGPVMVPMLSKLATKAMAKLLGDKIDGGGP